MNSKQYLLNLTQTDIENALAEELSVILSYVEQHRADVDFNNELLDKLTAFKEYANEANNKLILETALQEQAERQELIRERVRFIRQIEYIEKAYQVETGNERNNDAMRMQRQQAQTQQNYQQQYAAIMASFQPKWEAAAAFLKSETYQQAVKNLEKFVVENPDMREPANAETSAITTLGNPEWYENRQEQMIKDGFSPSQVQEANEIAANTYQSIQETVEKHKDNPNELILRGGGVFVDTALEVNRKGYDEYFENMLAECKRVVAKMYGEKECTPEFLKRFKKDLEAGKIKAEDLGKYTDLKELFADFSGLTALREEKDAIQKRMNDPNYIIWRMIKMTLID